MTDLSGQLLDFDYSLVLPEIIAVLFAMIVVGADAFKVQLKLPSQIALALTIVGIVCALVASLTIGLNHDGNFAGLIILDSFTTFFRVLFYGVTLTIVLGSHEYISKYVSHIGEFYGLLILATLGAVLMASAGELLTAYLGIELLSFSLYIAVSLTKGDLRSNEASLKYVLLGGVASASLLYGLSLLYGVSGSTDYSEIAAALSGSVSDLEPTLLLGLVMIIVGLGFKASAVPFHMWTPDAYEGAPIPVTAYLSATSKAATVAILLRWFGGPLLPIAGDWQMIFSALAVATMVVGNLVALQQTNIKRLLAYSSIGQMGYMLMAVVAVGSGYVDIATSGVLVHLAGYIITNILVFVGVTHFFNNEESEEISAFKGLAQTSPYLALLITAGLFSLAGMPLLVGFFTKFILFQAIVSAGHLGLVVVAVIASTVSLYYYLMVIRQMYLYEPEDSSKKLSLTTSGYVTTLMLFVAMVVLGLWGAPLYEVADTAATSLF